MEKKNPNPFILLALILVFMISACSALGPAFVPTDTPIPTPTATITLTPTNTPRPSPTPRPTKTPDLAATQHADELNAEAKKYFDLGYLTTTDGEFVEYATFFREWAQLGWYQRYTFDARAADSFMSAHLKWWSAYRNADLSGCGFVFANQDNGDHYAVFLDRSRVVFFDLDQSLGYARIVGVTRGTGRVKFDNPADAPVEADFTVIVKGAYAYVLVNGEVAGEYTLSQSKSLNGNLGLSILSGTNKDYGTRCEMSNIHLWIPNK